MPAVLFGADAVLFGADRVLFGDAPDTAPAPSGNPDYPWTLFRGQVIGKELSLVGELLRVKLDIEDYNRLGPLIKVGAPVFGNFIHQPEPAPEGTDVAIDADAQTGGNPPNTTIYLQRFHAYWDSRLPLIDDSTYVEDIDTTVPTLPDFATAMTDWKSFSDTFLRYMDPAARAWLDPDHKLHLSILSNYGVAAPFSLSEDDVPTGFRIRPMSLSVKWDFVKERNRIFIRGGTPVSSKWVIDPSNTVLAGEDYHDAPGAVLEADADAVAAWVFERINRTTLSGSAHIESGHDGWRPGQTLRITSERLSEEGYELIDRSAILQHLSGNLVGGGPGLTILKNGDDIGDKVVIQSFSFAESLEGPEKATLIVEVVDSTGVLDLEAVPGDGFADLSWSNVPSFPVTKLDDIQIITDGRPFIEYELNFGDIEYGDIGKALAGFDLPGDPEQALVGRPVYHFIVKISDPLAVLTDGLVASLTIKPQVVAQLSDAADKPVFLYGVIMEWLTIQWADDEMTVPGTGIETVDATGMTDNTGRVFTTLQQNGDPLTSNNYEIKALALPVD